MSLLSEARDEFAEKDLLLYASGIGFRFLVAAIPVTLFVIALLGSLGLEELWREDVAPELRENVSDAVFTVIDDAVDRVLGRENGYWITIGAAVAIVGLASIASGVTRTLNRVHEIEDSRRFGERALNHVAVGVGSGVLLLAAIAVVRLGPFAFEAVLGDGFAVGLLSFLVRWSVAVALLVALLVLMKRVAPDLERPLRRLAVGSAITVGCWVATSLLFGLYLEYVASYGSVFGNLATAYVAVQYVALSATVYVAGLVLDAVAIRAAGGGEGS